MEDKLDDLNYADDLCLISSTRQHIKEKSAKLNETSRSVGLNLKRKKTKVIRINVGNNNTVEVNGEELEDEDTFTCLGSIVATSGGAHWRGHNTENQQGPSCGPQMTIVTKLRIFNSNVKSVPFYG